MKKAAKIVFQIIRSFFSDDCLNLAANISFYALFSIIPLGMLTVSLAGYFFGASAEAHDELFKLISEILPVGTDIIIANIQSVVTQKSSLGIIGIIFLLVFATLLVSSIERALDKVFSSESKRNFFHSRLLGILLTFGLALLFSLPTIAQLTETALARFGFSFPLSEFMNSKVFFFLLGFIAFLICITVIPNHKVKLKYAVIGGLLFAPGVAIARLIFRWFMDLSMTRYNIIFGSLTIAVLIIVWIYYLAIVMLIASELVAVLQIRAKSKT